ncbi:MAG: glycosyltransferase family 4 protein [Myxococcota bacterium]
MSSSTSGSFQDASGPTMHIGVVTTSYPRDDADPSGRFVFDQVDALRARGHVVTVIAPEDAYGRGPMDGVAVRYAPRFLQRTFYGAGVPRNLQHPMAWPGLATFPLQLTRVLRTQASSWDAIVSHFAVPSALCARAAAGLLPHLAVWHSADVSLAARVPAMAELAKRAADHHWCVNARAARTLGLRRATVAPMAARVSVCGRDEARRRLGVGGPLVVAIGRLVPLKGLELALEASAVSQVPLVVIGDGPEAGALGAHAERLHAPVRFVGSLAPVERDRWLAAADAMAFTSQDVHSDVWGVRREGAPVVLLEAMALGLPVIATDVAAVRERIVHGKTGLVLPRDDRTAWAQAFRRAARGELHALGAAARRSVQHHRFDRYGVRIERALRAAVSCARARHGRVSKAASQFASAGGHAPMDRPSAGPTRADEHCDGGAARSGSRPRGRPIRQEGR